VTVTVGGMAVRPGDLLVGDQDGLLAFAPAMAASHDRESGRSAR